MARALLSFAMLLGLCLATGARAEAPPARPSGIVPATSEHIHQTVDRAIAYLQTESAAWLNTRKCAACHHVPMPLWALSEAEQQRYAIDKKFVADTIESLLGSKDKLLASKIFPNPADPPDPRPQGHGLNMGLPFLTVAAQSLPSLDENQRQSLKLIAEEIRAALRSASRESPEVAVRANWRRASCCRWWVRRNYRLQFGHRARSNFLHSAAQG